MIYIIITLVAIIAILIATKTRKSDPIKVYGNPAILITYPSGVRVLCSDRLVAADELGVSLREIDRAIDSKKSRIKIEEI